MFLKQAHIKHTKETQAGDVPFSSSVPFGCGRCQRRWRTRFRRREEKEGAAILGFTLRRAAADASRNFSQSSSDNTSRDHKASAPLRSSSESRDAYTTLGLLRRLPASSAVQRTVRGTIGHRSSAGGKGKEDKGSGRWRQRLASAWSLLSARWMGSYLPG